MVSCSVRTCGTTSKYNPGNYKWHRLPSDPALREKWIRICDRHEWTPTKSAVVCSKHFEASCFLKRGRVLLLKDSLPTLFIPIKIPIRRNASSYVNRDIQLPSPQPGTSYTLPIPPKIKSLEAKCAKLKQKIIIKNRLLKNARAKSKRLSKRIVPLNEVVKNLRNSSYLQDHICEVDIACRNNLLQKLLDGVNKKTAENGTEHDEDEDVGEDLRKFALTVHFYSPRSYVYIREKFDLCLPHVNTLREWYSREDCEPGFTKESFNTIFEISKKGPIFINLTFDEMKIREQTEVVGNKHYGYVNVGNDLHGYEVPIATEIMVFMAVSVNGHWKLPIGYFPSKSLKATEKATLLKICLDLLKNTNCEVVSITFDGTSTNLTMAEILGASLKTEPYFTYKGTQYNILYDSCHLIKLILNCLAELRIIYNKTGQKIEFQFIEQLNLLQINEGLHLANKLTNGHDDKLNNFRNSEATVEFLNNVNDIFDIFNSRNLNNYGFKKPLCHDNKADIFKRIDEIYDYFTSLKNKNGQNIIDTPKRLAFGGFLFNIISLEIIRAKYLDDDHLKFLPTYKLSQDHIETLFSAIRSNEGFNKNPTVKNFISAYKRLLCHTEMKLSENGNCLNIKKITIMSTSAMSTMDKINSSSNYNKILKDVQTSVDTPDQDDLDFQEEIVLLDSTASLSQTSMMIVTYISGYVVKKIVKKLKCDVCISNLTTTAPEILFNALVVRRDYSKTSQNFLVYPSHDVVTLCCSSEDHFRRNMKGKLMDNNVFAKNVLQVLRRNQHLLSILQNHLFDQEPLDGHRYLVMKGIVEFYFELRLKYETKLLQNQKITLRNHLNKTVIFRVNKLLTSEYKDL